MCFLKREKIKDWGWCWDWVHPYVVIINSVCMTSFDKYWLCLSLQKISNSHPSLSCPVSSWRAPAPCGQRWYPGPGGHVTLMVLLLYMKSKYKQRETIGAVWAAKKIKLKKQPLRNKKESYVQIKVIVNQIKYWS